MALIVRKGMWVQFNVPDDIEKLALNSGAWKTSKGKFCGVVAGESRTPDGITTHPSRIMFVDEFGANLRVIRAGDPVNLSVLDPLSDLVSKVDNKGEIPNVLSNLGIIGIAEDLELVEMKEDCPPSRRPIYHPKDIRKSLFKPSPPADVETLKKRITELEAQVATKK